MNIITRHFQVIQHTADTKDNTLFDFTYSHDDGKAVPNSNIKLQWILLYSAEYTAILINGYSKLIMWTVIVSLYMQNLQYVVTERIILIFSKQYVHVTSTNANIQDCDEVVCKQ